MTHRLRVRIAATAATLSVGLLSACATSDNRAPLSDVPSTSIDTASGAIVFPVDQYGLSASEDEYVTSAESIEMSLCASKDSVDFRPTPPVIDIANTVSTIFGPWVKSYTAKYGFVPPESDADLVANGVKGAPRVKLHGFASLRHNGTLTDSDWEVVNKCRDLTLDGDALAPPGPWSKPASTAATAALAGDKAQAIESDYNACLRSNGLEPDAGSPGFVRGADVNVISPQQIALALTVVDCKTKVHYVQRLSDLVDDAQAPIVAKYHKELVAQRQRIDAALEKSKRLIADYQHDHPEFK